MLGLASESQAETEMEAKKKPKFSSPLTKTRRALLELATLDETDPRTMEEFMEQKVGPDWREQAMKEREWEAAMLNQQDKEPEAAKN